MPEILFDHTIGRLTISGISSGENPRALYMQAIEWLNEYSTSPQAETELILKVAYFNTTSAKYLLDILEVVVNLNTDKSKAIIKWVCEKDDEDMVDAVNNFSAMLDYPIEIEETDTNLF